jgi:hypothetical protein
MCEFGTHTLIVSMSIKEIDRHVRCAMRSCEKEPKASTATITNTSCAWKRPDPQHHSQASLPAYFLAGRGIGVTPTCSSAVYGAP